MRDGRRAILSVSDKDGIVDLGRGLVSLGFDLLASDGTAKVLREAGVPVRTISEYTGQPEVLGGRGCFLTSPSAHDTMRPVQDMVKARAAAT